MRSSHHRASSLWLDAQGSMCAMRSSYLARREAAKAGVHALKSGTPMPGYGAGFGRGLILGVGAALLYAAARETIAPARRPAADTSPDQNKAQSDDRSRLIDWNLATQVAIRAAGRTPTLHPGARTQLQAQYEAMLRDIERPISGYVGNDLSLANTKVEVLDRPGWIRANMVNFRYLLQPVEDFYRENAMPSSFGPPPLFPPPPPLMPTPQLA